MLHWKVQERSQRAAQDALLDLWKFELPGQNIETLRSIKIVELSEARKARESQQFAAFADWKHNVFNN